jgi:hypothetical protein
MSSPKSTVPRQPKLDFVGCAIRYSPACLEDIPRSFTDFEYYESLSGPTKIWEDVSNIVGG